MTYTHIKYIYIYIFKVLQDILFLLSLNYFNQNQPLCPLTLLLAVSQSTFAHYLFDLDVFIYFNPLRNCFAAPAWCPPPPTQLQKAGDMGWARTSH